MTTPSMFPAGTDVEIRRQLVFTSCQTPGPWNAWARWVLPEKKSRCPRCNRSVGHEGRHRVRDKRAAILAEWDRW